MTYTQVLQYKRIIYIYIIYIIKMGIQCTFLKMGIQCKHLDALLSFTFLPFLRSLREHALLQSSTIVDTVRLER